jgi:hypothetical protein
MQKDRNNDCIENSQGLRSGPDTLTEDHKKAGSLKNRIPVQLDKNTVIFVHPNRANDIEIVKKMYETRNNIARKGGGNEPY